MLIDEPVNEELTAEPIDGELGLRWHVWNKRHPGDDPYLVDLSHHQGNGACSCPDFCCRRWVAIRDTSAPLYTKATTCKHLRYVHLLWHLRALPAYVNFHHQMESAEPAP